MTNMLSGELEAGIESGSLGLIVAAWNAQRQRQLHECAPATPRSIVAGTRGLAGLVRAGEHVAETAA